MFYSRKNDSCLLIYGIQTTRSAFYSQHSLPSSNACGLSFKKYINNVSCEEYVNRMDSSSKNVYFKHHVFPAQVRRTRKSWFVKLCNEVHSVFSIDIDSVMVAAMLLYITTTILARLLHLLLHLRYMRSVRANEQKPPFSYSSAPSSSYHANHCIHQCMHPSNRCCFCFILSLVSTNLLYFTHIVIYMYIVEITTFICLLLLLLLPTMPTATTGLKT